MIKKAGPKSTGLTRQSLNFYLQRLFVAASLCLSALLPSACKNAFEEPSTKNTNEAYFFDAKRAIDQKNYDLAIQKLTALTPAYQERREVVTTFASAYAGRCGLDFLTLATAIADNPGARLFVLLTNQFRDATTGAIADCLSAETWMRKLAPTNDFTALTADENVFLAIVSFAKIGAILGTYADVDNDGVADAGFDSCNTTQFPDADARAVGVSLNLAISALGASGSDLAGAALANMTSTCGSLPGGANFCSLYEPTDFTAPMIKVLNGVIKSNDIVGVGTCNNTYDNCVCP